MKIIFDRRKIETFSIVLSLVLIILLTFFGILATADEIFNWDILPPNMENIMILLMASIGMSIAAAFLICLMVNISLISLSLEKIADQNEK